MIRMFSKKGVDAGEKKNEEIEEVDNHDLIPPPQKNFELPQEFIDAEEEDFNGRKTNPSIKKYIMDHYIESEMRKKEDSFSTYKDVSVWCGTWNVNGNKVDEDITEWLTGEKEGVPDDDIYVLGLEEMVDLTATSIVMENQSQKRAEVWKETLYKTLNKDYENPEEDGYKFVDQKILVGVYICIYAKAEIYDLISNVMDDTAAVGFMGIMGNKGGAGIRFNLDCSNICFVCSHLAAHREKVYNRNADFHSIIDRLRFSNEAKPSLTESKSYNNIVKTEEEEKEEEEKKEKEEEEKKEEDDEEEDNSNAYKVLDHDVVIWIGDLNYRITTDVPTMTVFEQAEAGQLDYLLKKDQLIESHKAGLVFEDFTEPAITFPPTYKYVKKTNTYDKRNEKKLRAPAWCDRVLYHLNDTVNEDTIEVQKYDHVMDMMASDHKPVYCLFKMKVKHHNKKQMKTIRNTIEKELNDVNSNDIPDITVSTESISFDNISYKVPQEQTIQITNNGSNIAYFNFLAKAEDRYICKHMYNITPSYGMILPGEHTDIKVECNIDIRSAQELNKGDLLLEDIVTLRVHGDNDYHIQIDGSYNISSFGQTLDNLVKMKLPIRKCTNLVLTPVSPSYMNIPKEMWRMVDYLYKNGLYTKGLWIEKGEEDKIRTIREALDTGDAFQGVDALSMADAFQDFLSSLYIPILPDIYTQKLEGVKKVNMKAARAFVDTLPTIHRNSFIYIIMFLRELLKYDQQNDLTPAFLSMVFARCLISPPVNKHSISKKYRTIQEAVTSLLAVFLKSSVAELCGEEEEEEGEEEGEGEEDDDDDDRTPMSPAEGEGEGEEEE
ncbi:hypothetical protein WA158_002637 [Blastocystis sp. Blastoise]